jgi:hypothetical protein
MMYGKIQSWKLKQTPCENKGHKRLEGGKGMNFGSVFSFLLKALFRTTPASLRGAKHKVI